MKIFSEFKKILFLTLVLASVIFVLPDSLNATDYSSGSFTVKDPVIDSGFQSSSSLNFGLGQSLSQIAIGKSTSASFQLWSGFQYFYLVNQNVLTATAGDAEVDLAWTVPQTYLGVVVDGYEVGTGTTSGSYTFEDVGNVVNFTKTGLTNGTPYYFIIKAYAPGGTFLVFSNEDTATPNGVVPPPPPSSGGGGSSGGKIVITGYAYPNSTVTLLKDSVAVSTSTAGSDGSFSVNRSGMSSGTYTFSVYGTDPDGLKSPNLTYEREISNSVTTTITAAVVGPTIKANYSTVKQGETITFSGYTGPNSSVTLTFAGTQSLSRTVTSDSTGLYNFGLLTSGLPKGGYTVYATSFVAGLPSARSELLNFTIGDATVIPPTTGECVKRSDLNCDGFVNLIDFSILLYFWESSDFSRNPRVDIDNSGSVSLRDLSIMLYDWTG